MTTTRMATLPTPRLVLGDLSGITAASLVLSGLVGVAWGFCAPRATVRTLGEGSFIPPADYGAHDFPLYIAYLLIVIIGGAVIGWVVSRVSSTLVGQLVAVVVGVVSAVTVLAAGHVVAYQLSDRAALLGPEGVEVAVRSAVDVGTAFLWAPLAAATAWLWGISRAPSEPEE